MSSGSIDRMLQIIERVENKTLNLLLESGYDLQNKYFDSENSKICNDENFNSCTTTVITIAYATDEVKNSNSSYWDRQSNFWVVEYYKQYYVLQVIPSTKFDTENLKKLKENQKSGSGKIINVWLVKDV